MMQSSLTAIDTAHSLPAHHFRAFILALFIVILFFPCLYFVLPLLERPFMRDLLAQPFTEKDQGIQVQMEAVRRQDVMPIYGSSELRTKMEMKGDEFFRKMPTGFQLCPVGAAGNTTLMMAQKIAAQGTALRGQKMAFIISHTWFRRPETPSAQMQGNFSPLQAISFLQDEALDEELRSRFLKRMIAYPKAMESYPVINDYLNSMVEQGWIAETKKCVLGPVLRLQRAWYSLEDRLDVFEALFKYDMLNRGRWTEDPKTVPWSKLIMEKEREVSEEKKRVNQEIADHNDGSRDEVFLSSMRSSKEWDDFALLLDTLKYFQADPLIITVPLPGPSLDRHHVTRKARDYYYDRIESMCRKRVIACETFSDQDMAIDFLIGSGTHLETKGWLYVNRLLDDFFHNRVHTPLVDDEP